MITSEFNPIFQREDLLHVPPVEAHLIRSRHVQQTFNIQVMQPARKEGDTRRYPVVYATDGNWTFEMFKSISYLLQMSAHDAPPFVLVGIGYPAESPHAGFLLRMRDFTYPPYQPTIRIRSLLETAKTSKDWPSADLYEGMLLPEEGAKDCHGGEDFRKFIGAELIPFIDEKYPTIPGHRTYFGHSGGGFFGLYTLFTQSELFKNYIVSSPGLIFDGKGPGGIRYENCEFGPQMIRDFAASGRSMNDVKLYLSAGEEEEFEPGMNWRLTSTVLRATKLLKDASIPGLELMTEVFPGETHITVWPIAFTHGVQAVFGTRRVLPAVYFKTTQNSRAP